MAVTITKGAILTTFLVDRSAGVSAAATSSTSGNAGSTARLSSQVTVAPPAEAAVPRARPRGNPPEGAIRDHSEAKETAEEVADQIRNDEEGSAVVHTNPLLVNGRDEGLL